MGGLEPPSKHRTRQLSTCLSVPLVVGDGLPEGGLTEAYLLRLDGGQESRPRASGLNDTPGSEQNRPKVRGILVGDAALAPRIKQFDCVKLGSECVVVVGN